MSIFLINKKLYKFKIIKENIIMNKIIVYHMNLMKNINKFYRIKNYNKNNNYKYFYELKKINIIYILFFYFLCIYIIFYSFCNIL